MLNGHEMDMAKELAYELVQVKKEKERESIKEVFEMLEQMKLDVFNAMTRIWGAVRGTISGFFENEKETNYFRNTWYVPTKIEAPPMPDFRLPRNMNIRSDL